jgi:hypothetical protein
LLERRTKPRECRNIEQKRLPLSVQHGHLLSGGEAAGFSPGFCVHCEMRRGKG